MFTTKRVLERAELTLSPLDGARDLLVAVLSKHADDPHAAAGHEYEADTHSYVM